MLFLKCALCQFIGRYKSPSQGSKQPLEMGGKPRSPPGQGEPTVTHWEHCRFLMLLTHIVSGISCLFQGEIGFRKFGGLITTDCFSLGKRLLPD